MNGVSRRWYLDVPMHAGQAPPPIQPTPSHWGLITAGDVQAEQQRTLTSAQGTDQWVQACATMDPTTKAEWATFLAGLTTWCTTPMVNIWTPWMASNAVVVTGDTGDTMMAWEAQLANWQAQLATACPQAPGPAPPGIAQYNPPGPGGATPPSWLCTTFGIGCEESSWASTIKWLAILGVIGVTVWYTGPLIATLVGAASTAVRRRTERQA